MRWRERRGSNAPANPRFPAEKLTQTKASQRDSSFGVNQGFQDERENGNGSRVFQPLQSGCVRDPKLIPHPPGCACVRIGQRGIQRRVAPAALPDQTAFIQNPDERTRLVAVADLDGTELSNPPPKMRI